MPIGSGQTSRRGFCPEFEAPLGRGPSRLAERARPPTALLVNDIRRLLPPGGLDLLAGRLALDQLLHRRLVAVLEFLRLDMCRLALHDVPGEAMRAQFVRLSAQFAGISPLPPGGSLASGASAARILPCRRAIATAGCAVSAPSPLFLQIADVGHRLRQVSSVPIPAVSRCSSSVRRSRTIRSPRRHGPSTPGGISMRGC